KGLYEWIKIKWNVIKSGRYKDILSPFRNLRNDEKRLLFKIVQDSYRQFYNEVLKSRKIKPVLLNRYAQGQIFSGNQARTIKLVDELGGFEDAVMAIGKMIGVSGRPYIIRRRRSVSFTDIFRLLENFQKGFQGFKLIKHSPSTGYVNISYLYRSF
ncbi:MAG: S49 family peptidase, partial [Spirochaetes bacterium]|nr:S49 family peptidase [Spirochaetota bacterium]